MHVERHNSFRMHSYEKCACKSCRTHSYKIVGLKVPCFHILPKKAGGGPPKALRGTNCDPCQTSRPRAERGEAGIGFTSLHSWDMVGAHMGKFIQETLLNETEDHIDHHSFGHFRSRGY